MPVSLHYIQTQWGQVFYSLSKHTHAHKRAAPHSSKHFSSDRAPIRGERIPPQPPAPDSEKSSHTPGGHRGPHARMTSALSPEEPVTAICKLNMTNRFPASPPGRRDERWRARGGDLGKCVDLRLKCERKVRGCSTRRDQISQVLSKKLKLRFLIFTTIMM